MPQPRGISIRDALIAVLMIASVISGMRIGGMFASAVIFALFSLFVFRCIVAIAGAPSDRQQAAGFAVPFALYGCLLAAIGQSEFDPASQNYLFTSQVLTQTFNSINNNWICASRWELMALGHTLFGFIGGITGSFFATTSQMPAAHVSSNTSSKEAGD